jgi:predicted ester cyclase
MTRAAILQQLSEHQVGYANRDPDRLAASHAPDGTFASPAYGIVHGRDKIRDVYRYWYNAFPDFMLSWEAAIIDPPRAATFWLFEGTAVGPFFGDVKAGTRVKMDGASEFVFGEDGIVSVRHVFDFSKLLVATGVLRLKPAS